MARSGTKTALKAAFMNKALLDKDVLVRNEGVKERLDWVGDFLTDLKTQWNASVVATDLTGTITQADYDSKDYE